MKGFSANQNIRDEYYRDNKFAVDLIEIHLLDSSGRPDPLLLSTGMLDIDYDSPTAPIVGSNTYSAQGQFMSMTAINEQFDIVLGKMTITLSGLPTGMISRFVDTEPEGKAVYIYKTFLDLNTLAIIEEPILMFGGETYNVIIQEAKNTCSIGVEVASIFADFDRRSGRATNDWSNWNYQGSTYDTAMEKSGFVGNTEFLWGRSA
jgi:hypothetical protein